MGDILSYVGIGRLGLVLLLFALLGCRETSTYSSGEFDSFTGSQSLDVTDAEAEVILEQLLAQYEAGADLSNTVSAIMAVLFAQLSAENPWVGLTLSQDQRDQLRAKHQNYRSQIADALDNYGFVAGCDGLLFSSLLHFGGYEVDYEQAESQKEPGRWFRSVEKDCYSSGRSASTISRDMLLGLALAIWKDRNLGAAERLLSYSEANNRVIGEAKDTETLLGRAFLSPAIEATYYELRYRLGGENSPRRGYIPDMSTGLTGFQAHLQALGILLRGAIYGGILDQDLSVLASLRRRQPDNALFQVLYAGFTNGDAQDAIDVLMNETWFPNDRLPESSDRCESYLWQRDQNSDDWQPCPEKDEQHPPVDFMFVSELLLGDFPFQP